MPAPLNYMDPSLNATTMMYEGKNNLPTHQPGPGSLAPQLIDFYWQRKALIDLKEEMYFGQLADTTTMPKHYGKTIKVYHYIPLLDDRNINDQGIDATGATTANEVTIDILDPIGKKRKAEGKSVVGAAKYAVGTGADAAAALLAAQNEAVTIIKNLGITGFTTYADMVTALEAKGWEFVVNPAVNKSGNLYGSSKDIGTIVGSLPRIDENGGRKNRVGFTRLTIEGSIEEFGFFEEYTEDSLQFDNDAELMSHISRETMRAANYIVEDMLQIDLLNAANVVFYGGAATSESEITGETGATASKLDYEMLIKLDTILNDNKCPKDTKLISGSRMIDTKTIASARYAYIGAELKLQLLKMDDFHGEKAFIPIQQYAAAGNIARGEIGSVGHFRFIEVPKMLHWEGAGAAVTNNAGYMTGIAKEAHGGIVAGTECYNVYPMLVVGSGAFTTIGFQTSGNSGKFKIYHKKPGLGMADRHDPYGKLGFYSIQWYDYCLAA